MPAEIMRGDVFALTITLIAFFIAVVVINRLTGMLIVVLKKIILFIIVTLAFWQFITMFAARVSTEGLTNDTLIFGAIGFVIGFTAIGISLYVALRSLKNAHKGPALPALKEREFVPDAVVSEPFSTTEIPGAPPKVSATSSPGPVLEGSEGGTVSAIKDSLSINNLKNDKSLGAVLAYLIIAQFGVFSSMTIPAPSFEVGVAFFAIFIIAGLFFIHFTYHNYLTGLRHLILAILVGAIIAIVLGNFWGNIPLNELLSPAFFQSSALVALVTGLALSLFMGGKG
jgi:hypothetical protein